MIPIFKSRCGWCVERETVIDRLVDRMPDLFFKAVIVIDRVSTPIARAWHDKFH